MPKPNLAEPYATLEGWIIDTLLAGHKEWRPDLAYPQSHSDMQGAVRGLLRMFEVKRRLLPLDLPYADCICGVVEVNLSEKAAIWVRHVNPECPAFQQLKRLAGA